MFRLIQFLSSQKNLLLFIFLEIIALWFIVRFNNRQQHAFGDRVLEISGNVHTQRAKVTTYFSMGQENERLHLADSARHDTIDRLRSEIQALQDLLGIDTTCMEAVDSIITQMNFEYISCRAIKNSTAKNYNYITLNKGRRHGVKIGMGVVSPNGIAGRVIGMKNNFSIALSALNVSFKLSVRVAGTDNVGSYEWIGNDPEHGDLRYIPLDIPLTVGQPVVTSGFNTIFPPEFPVGHISELKKDREAGFHKAKVKLATDFRALGPLYLVEPLHKATLDSLEQDLNL